MSIFRISKPVAPLQSAPSHNATCVSEALYGERATALEAHGQWMLVRQQHDGYEGFIHSDGLIRIDEAYPAPTHWVALRSTLLFSEPDIKSRVIYRVPFASELTLASINSSSFSKTHCGFYIRTDHCLPLGTAHPLKPIELARSYFLGAPYLWGGRSPEGADCSGLIQLLARSQGIRIPRDSGDQEKANNHTITEDQLRPNDIVYWPGHTGLLLDHQTLLHATAHSLSCVEEPLEAVINRAGTPSSYKRLFT